MKRLIIILSWLKNTESSRSKAKSSKGPINDHWFVMMNHHDESPWIIKSVLSNGLIDRQSINFFAVFLKDLSGRISDYELLNPKKNFSDPFGAHFRIDID